jgi:SAM-dependent methyltransferase
MTSFGACKGQATTELTPFKQVIGVDPSGKMIDAARKSAASHAQLTNTEDVNRFKYVKGDAENLSFLEDGSVDLIIAGPHNGIEFWKGSPVIFFFIAQAAHWFEWSKLWPEAARVLREGGSAAFWVCPTLFAFPILIVIVFIHRFTLNSVWQDILL